MFGYEVVVKRLGCAVGAVALLATVAGCGEKTPAAPAPVASAAPVAAAPVVAPPPKPLALPVALIDAYPNAKLNSEVAVQTPSGHGAFYTNAWPTTTAKRNSLIIVSGFSVIMPPIHLGPTSKVTFEAGMAYPSPVNARLWMGVQAGTEVKRVWEQDVVAPKAATELKPYSVDLTAYADKDVQLVIGMETPKGDSSGHWGVFADPQGGIGDQRTDLLSGS